MVLDGHDPLAIAQAARALADGELVALPTETVYGLGARADDDGAVGKIFAAKGRPADHPLIVHVFEAGDAMHFAADLPPVARRLMDSFWPGPLTIIVPRAAGIATAAAGGQATIGLRCPAHPVARALLAAARGVGVRGVAAPSANRFGRVSPTQAAHVAEEFDEGLLILDGGACELGIESSIVDCSRAQPVLLRPGVLTLRTLEAAAGAPLSGPDSRQNGPAPRASGTLAAHYAPRATVRLLSAATLTEMLAKQWPTGVAVYSRTALRDRAPDDGWQRRMPDDARAAAHELFAVLRELDAAGARQIWIENAPQAAEWDGVRDRLSRAAAAFNEPVSG